MGAGPTVLQLDASSKPSYPATTATTGTGPSQQHAPMLLFASKDPSTMLLDRPVWRLDQMKQASVLGQPAHKGEPLVCKVCVCARACV